MMLELKRTTHPYYCEEYATHTQTYDSWSEFKEAFNIETIDHDLNYVIRFDICKHNRDKNEVKRNDYYVLKLFYMQQRRGRFVPVIVNNIEEKDMVEINKYLKECSEYIKTLWEEFIK